MKLGIAQVGSVLGDFKALQKDFQKIDAHFAQEGADLVVYPSSFVACPTAEGLLDQPMFRLDLSKTLARAFASLEVPSIVPVVFPYRGEAHPELLYVANGHMQPLRFSSQLRLLETHPLAAMMDAEEFGEGASSQFCPQISWEGKTILFALDWRQMHELFESAPPQGKPPAASADAVIFLPFTGLNIDNVDSAHGQNLAQAPLCEWAKKTDTWIVCVNGFGGYDEELFTGSSYAITPWGEVAAVLPAFETELATVDIDFSSEGPLKHPLQPPKLSLPSFLFYALAEATKSYVEKAGFKGACFVLRGDIGTSLLATVLVEALGPKRVHAVVAPAPASSAAAKDASTKDACTIAKRLHISYEMATLPEMPNAKKKTKNNGWYTTLALRAVAEAEAAQRSYASVSAVDKTCLALGEDVDGWQGSLWAPFFDIYHSSLYALAEARNSIGRIIPAAVFKRGRPFSEVEKTDTLLAALIEGGEPLALLEERLDDIAGASKIVRHLYDCEKYRSRLPLGPIVSAYSLRERALPVMSRWEDHFAADELEQKQLMQGKDNVLEAQFDQVLDKLSAREEAEDSSAEAASVAADELESALTSLHDVLASGMMEAAPDEEDDLFNHGFFSDN